MRLCLPAVRTTEEQSPSWSLTNGSGIPGWVYRGTNTLAVQVGNNDACIHDAVITVGYTYTETSTTSVTSNANPAVYGQAVTFTATVTPLSNGPATGTVTFADGATPLGTATLNGADQAFLSVATLTPGTHTIHATYNGDSNFQSSSGTLSQVVNQASTITALASSVNPSIVGQNVTFTATVTVSAPGAGIPTGLVTFFDGATTLGTATVGATGVATLSTAALAVGTHFVTASYGGSSLYLTSTSSAVDQVVRQDATTVAVVSSLDPSTFGASVTFTATVTTQSTGGTPTGTVTFTDGGTPIGTSSLNGSGVATFSTSALAGGVHTIGAAYSGDADHDPASGSLVQTVDVAPSTTALASAANPSVFGQPVQLTATVTTLGTGTLNGSGIAALVASSLTVGTHTITAAYAGSASSLASTSGPLSQIVNTDGVTATLASSLNPSAYGASVTFTATVTTDSTGGPPTGTVTFADGGTPIGSGALNGSGVAIFTTAALSGGSHAMTAVYGGDTDHAGGSSGALTQVVNVATSTTGITSSAMGAVEPSGSVTFSDGATTLGTAMLDAFGVATFPTSQLAVGTHMLVAVYAGDSNYASSASTAMSQVVGKASTTTAVTSSSNPASIGTPVTFSAAVVAVAPGSGTPTGQVTFFDGTTTLGTGTLNGMGVATLTTSSLTSGSHSITASYAGDSSFLTSTSALPAGSLTLTATYGGDATYTTASATTMLLVDKAATVTKLASSANPAAGAESVTFTATVTSGATGFTGNVAFTDGTTMLGTAPLIAGAATFSTRTLDAGGHMVSATYSGDSNFNGSTSTALTETIGSGDGGVPEGGLSADSGSEAGTSDGGANAATSGTGGCGCRVGASAPGAGLAAILGLGIAAVLLRRRRRA